MFHSKSTTSLTNTYRWFGAFSVIALLSGSILYPSAKIFLGQRNKIDETSIPQRGVSVQRDLIPGYTSRLTTFLPVMQQNPALETVATYAADCTTPKTVFELGEEVCAVTTGVTTFSPAQRSLTWSDPLSVVIERTDLETTTQDKFTLPTEQTSQIDGLVIDNRGTWRVNLTPAGRSVVRAAAFFTVQDPANPAVDLNVYNSVDDEDGVIPAGTTITVRTIVTNFGPDAASPVELTEEVPSNATFVSEQQTAGPSFNCTNPGSDGIGTSSCTITSLAKGDQAVFAFVYEVSAGAPTNTALASLATVTSTTAELNTGDNQWTARAKVTQNENAVVCALGCPANRTVTATTTQGGNLGAIVNFTEDIESSGDCGTVTTSPSSGSFFPLGTTPVSVTSSTGGGSCSFTVTVVDTPAPTITCAADQTAPASGSQLDVTVSVNAPTATGNNVQITGTRSDNRPLDDSYPVGTTTITWTAKECNDPPDCADPFARSASCTQKIIVTSADAPTISCPTNRTFTAPSGSCSITVLSEDLGLPSTTGTNVTVTNERSDGEAFLAPFPAGQTIITWTATDDVGRNASCNQVITVQATDNTPPTLNVPPNINTTTSSCSIVLDDELGVATADDNCTASVSIIRTGVPAGFVFPTGTTIITYKATDAAGNHTTATQSVTVLESPAVPPTIMAPANVTINTGAGATSCGTLVGDATLGTATAADNCGAVSIARTGVPAGNNFPVGDTFVTYTATDASGNTASATQKVTVVDNTPPIVTPPGAVTLFTGPGATSCGVTVANLDATLGTGTATDNCAGVGAVVRTGVPSGNQFPLGTTTLTYSATDAHGNSSSAMQVVTVVDNTAPVISCPANITLEPTCPAGAVGTYTPPVGSDNCAGVTTSRTAGLASGSIFSIGSTIVTYTANDANGNSSSCSFTVIVLTPQQVIQNMINTINALPLSGTQRQGLISKLTAALDAINQGKQNVACNKLNDFNSQVSSLIGNGNLTPAQGQPLINSAAHLRNYIGCTNLGCS